MAGLNSAQIREKARQMGKSISEQEVQQILSSAWDQSQYGADEGTVISLLGGGGGGGANKIPTAEDILGAQLGKIKEQVTFLKDFMGSNPFAFDESLARNMATEKYKPYYTEVLSDFVDPLREKITRSTEDETKVLTELTRQEKLGATQISRETQAALDAAREGFAGSGLLGSGIANRAEGVQGIQASETMGDFMAKSAYQKDQQQTNANRFRTDTQTAIDQKTRDVMGTGRALDTSIAQDVESQRGMAQKQYANKVLESVTSRFGAPMTDINQFLKY